MGRSGGWESVNSESLNKHSGKVVKIAFMNLELREWSGLETETGKASADG